MIDKDRVIEIGQADVSFDSWITFQDNGTIEQEEKRWNFEKNVSVEQDKVITKKPWWKFW